MILGRNRSQVVQNYRRTLVAATRKVIAAELRPVRAIQSWPIRPHAKLAQVVDWSDEARATPRVTA
jgi:hypothetical protein